MIKLGCGILAVACLLAAVLVLWSSPVFPENLPHHFGDWILAWISLFRNPAAAAIFLSTALAMLVGAMCLSDILVGIFFSLLAALFAILCLTGAVASRFEGVAHSLQSLFR